LIKSTPEGARDFVVPSRMNPGQFYALPQSPQQFKQLLMVAGFDRYFQIVKCFRDEDLRADRQPEFTQIDCEMSFVEQEDVIQMFEGLMKHLFKTLKGIDFTEPFPRMTWEDAMNGYGSDKPDLRFGMKFVELKDIIPAGQFSVFDDAPYVAGICAEGCASYTRKQLDQLTDFVKRSQVGAKGLIWVRVDENGALKSSVDKFYTPETLAVWADRFGAKPGDLMLILCGEKRRTQKQLCALRLEMGQRLGLMDKSRFVPLWVIDFPLFEWDDETQRFYATHHPFTMPNPEDIPLLDTDPGKVRAWAYDCVVNGVELGGGSVRIHDSQLQERMFELLGFTPDKAMAQFGCLINAFRFGAPPHAGLAFGLDRVVSMFAELDSIRDCIAFPKNNAGRDTMMDAPTAIDQAQLDELQLALNLKGE
jgi:aspartyl-tRNA synthetase